jgi:hypothetical protein
MLKKTKGGQSIVRMETCTSPLQGTFDAMTLITWNFIKIKSFGAVS